MYRLNLLSVGLLEENASVVVVLKSEELAKLLIMEVGLLEGRAIALASEGAKTSRPLTHDLTQSIISGLGATIHHIEIREFRDKVFYANLVLQQGDEQIELDARPSDALALAIRADAPILASEQVMEVAGITEEEAELEEGDDIPDDDGAILH